MSGAFNKVMRLGVGEYGSVFCKIRFDGRKLSISGVEGPKSDGDARGSCGQIYPVEIKTYAPGWDADLVARFWGVWERWHLNDMRPECEHQRAIDTSEKVEVVSYGLTTEAYYKRESALKSAAIAAANGTPATLDDTDRALILLTDWYKERHSPPDADSPLSGCYEVKKREQKAVGWIRPDEHPRGLLGKPCEVCGYKYGTAGVFERIPPDVLDFLESLPDTDKTPAWV